MPILVLTPQPARVRRLGYELDEELVFVADLKRLPEKLETPWTLTLVDDDVCESPLNVVRECTAKSQRVVLMTRNPTMEGTIAAVRAGAVDVMPLPLDVERLKHVTNGTIEKANWSAATASAGKLKWIGSSPVLMESFRMAGHAADSTMHVVITGEGGTGKELLARIIHESSNAREEPFVAINCAALDEIVLATELFGGVRQPGNITLEGQLARAGNGTVFLDEIAHLSPALQARLGAAMRTRRYTSVGGYPEKSLNARVIAASSADLRARRASGAFSADLHYEFGLEITLPPLRRRVEDVSLLASYFVDEFARVHDRDVRGFEPGVIEVMEKYDWPGNVHQLRHTVEHAVLATSSQAVGLSDLLPDVSGTSEAFQEADSESISLESVERRHIRRVWRITGGRLSETAELLGIHRNTLRRKLEQYGITEDDART